MKNNETANKKEVLEINDKQVADGDKIALIRSLVTDLYITDRGGGCQGCTS